jgi:signal transduction histidine kinase
MKKLGLFIILGIFQVSLMWGGNAVLPIQSIDGDVVLPKEIQDLLNQVESDKRKDIQQCIKICNTALEIALQKKDELSAYAVEHRIGRLYEDNNMMDSARVHYVKSLGYSIHNQWNQYTSSLYIDMAIVYKREGNFAVSKEYYLKGLNLAKEIKDAGRQEFAYHGLGTLHDAMGEYEQAANYYWESVHLAEQRGFKEGVVNTIQNLAITYTKLKNNKTALETIDRAYKLALEEKNTLLISSVLFDYGKVLNAGGDYDGAITKYQASLDSCRASNFKPLIARTLFYMADAYTAKGDYETAQRYFEDCSKYEGFIALKSSAELNSKLGDLYIRQQQWDKAKEVLEKSFAIADKHNYKDLKKEVAGDLAIVFQQLNDYASAYQYMNIASNLKDTLYNEAQSKGITELQMKYDTEKADKQIQALKLKQTQTILAFGGIFLLATILISLYVIRLRGKNNKELQQKNIQIEDQNRLLIEKNAALEQFAYAAAHDLKEPLRNIGSFISLIQRRYTAQLDDAAREYMTYITTAVKRMNDLLSGLLNFSELTAEKATFENVKLSEVLSIVKDNLKLGIEEKKATIEYDESLPTVPMMQMHIIQILQNLIGNALKFVEGQPMIKILAADSFDHVLLTISDNGIGMDKAYESKVFRLFHRLDKNREYEGNGIGLTICKNIVEKYGGKIWYESELGKGTRFFIYLPKSQMAIAA